MNQYHPDKVATLGAELQELAHNKAERFNTAYAILKKNGFAE
jgi:DnaJ-domain-containing protein 1